MLKALEVPEEELPINNQPVEETVKQVWEVILGLKLHHSS